MIPNDGAAPTVVVGSGVLVGNGAVVGSGAAVPRTVLKGELPSPLHPPPGCVFSTRCPQATERCRVERPALRELAGRQLACHLAEQFVQPAAPQH